MTTNEICSEIFRVGKMAETIIDLKKQLREDPLDHTVLESMLADKLIFIHDELGRLRKELKGETPKTKLKLYLVPKESSVP